MSEEEKTSSSEMGAKEHEALFKGFVSLITGMTMQQLGKVTNPSTGKVERNLDVARAWIETLKMMKVKTKGNLSDEESRFLDTNIANLQTKYINGPRRQRRNQRKKRKNQPLKRRRAKRKKIKPKKPRKRKRKKNNKHRPNDRCCLFYGLRCDLLENLMLA